MASITSNPQIFAADPHTISSTQQHPLGSKGVTADGRVYRYAQAAGTALDPGKLVVAADIVSNHADIAVNTFAVGDTSVSVTLGATLAAENDYAEGYLVVNDDTGEGIAYLISGHAAIGSGGTGTIYLAEPIKVAAAAATTVTLVKNKYKDLVISATDQADIPVGVPNVSITADYYGWVQTGGMCSVLADEAFAGGDLLTIGTSVAGALEAHDAAGELPVAISVAGLTVTDAEYPCVNLTLDN